MENKRIFCTLFDSNYLDKGLALYHSMREYMNEFKIYIFAFDEKCFDVLSDMNLKNAVVLSVDDIMDDTLERIKRERTGAEFCWTCSSVITEYVLLTYQEEICTYIDADIYFFSDPQAAIQEIIDNRCSVGLVEHRFERDIDYGRNVFSYGRYCIQFNTFVNDADGMRVLGEWKNECLRWCYNRCEDGKMGDQKYPDKWKQKYSCIYEAKQTGLGVAPWNLHLYSDVSKEDGKILLMYKEKRIPLIFYHFEKMRYLDNGSVWMNLWKPCSKGTRKKTQIIYGQYFGCIERIRKYLEKNYSITFRHMEVDSKSFLKSVHPLKAEYMENGFVKGLYDWRLYHVKNIANIKSRYWQYTD